MNFTRKEVCKMAKTEKKEITAKSITEKLQDVEEKKTKAQLANDKRLYNKFLKQIDTAYGKAEKAYLDIAIAIHSIYKKELYKVENFKNIYDFVKEKYNYSRGTCNKYINICERFGVTGETGTVVGLQDKYSQYGVSQLGIMLCFPDVLLEQVQPSMSVRALKQLAEDYQNSLSDQRQAIESENKDIIDTVVGESEDSAMNEPDTTGVEVMNKSTFVCQASTMSELLGLQEIMEDTFKDILKEHPEAKIRVNIVY